MRAGVPWRAMRTELLGGQYLDVLHQATRDASQAAALRIDRYKTAAYTVERPLHLGAALAGAGPELVDGYRRFGADIGIAFQLRDDLLGVFGDPAVTGKPAGDDLREGKRTLLLAIALERAERRGDTAARAAVEAAVGNPGLTAEEVDRTRDVLTELGAVQAVEQRIAALTGSALDALAAAPVAAPAATRAGRAGRHRDPASPLRSARPRRRPPPRGRREGASTSRGHRPRGGRRRRAVRAVRRAPPARRGQAGDDRRTGATTPAAGWGRLDLTTEHGTFHVDTGATVLTMPDLLDEAFAAVGEKLAERLDLVPLDPAYRAHFADGSTIDVHTDADAMEAEIRRVCGPDVRRRATAALRAWLGDLYRTEIDTFIGANIDSPLAPARPRPRAAGAARRVRAARAARRPLPPRRPAPADLLLPVAVRGCRARPRAGRVRGDRLHGHRRGRVVPDGRHARASARRSPTRPRRPGHGSTTGGRSRGWRGAAVGSPRCATGRRADPTDDSEALPCDAVVLTPDLPGRRRAGRPRPAAPRAAAVVAQRRGAARGACAPAAPRPRTTRSPSARRGSGRSPRSSRRAADERPVAAGHPAHGHRPDARAARHPTSCSSSPRAPTWSAAGSTGRASARPTATSCSSVLAARAHPGLDDIAGDITVSRLVTPADWAADGLAAGTPFSAAHTLRADRPVPSLATSCRAWPTPCWRAAARCRASASRRSCSAASWRRSGSPVRRRPEGSFGRVSGRVGAWIAS